MTDTPDQRIVFTRKKPAQGRAWHTVRTIFEATAQILEKDGERGLTTNRVAEKAGFSIGTLYQYFPRMDAILGAMIDTERERVMGLLEAVLADAEAAKAPPAETVRAFIRIMVAEYATGSGARMFLLRRAWRYDHLPQVQAAAQVMAARIQLWMERIGHPDYPAPEGPALFVVTRGVLGALRAAVLEGTELPGTQAFEDALVRLILAMMRRGGDDAPP